MDILFPTDQAKEEAEKAAQARKMASGTTSNQPPAPASAPQDQTADDEDDEDENDENDEDDEDDEIGDDDGIESFEDD